MRHFFFFHLCQVTPPELCIFANETTLRTWEDSAAGCAAKNASLLVLNNARLEEEHNKVTR